MILRRRSRFAFNACSATPATPFTNVRSQPTALPLRMDESRSCCGY